ncbi:transcriptional regulator, partial [Brevundimonas sp.]
VPRDNHAYQTGPLHKGSLSEPVEAFQGEVQFNVTIRTSSGTQSIAIDLNDMGATPRTMDAVIDHINGTLKTAGVETRFSRQDIPGEPRKMTVGDRTITLPATGNSWGLRVAGNSSETVGFQAVSSGSSVHVIQGNGLGGNNQALKFDPAGSGGAGIGDTNWVDGRTGQSNLPDGISTVRASAAAADGGMWIVADMTADAGGHTVRGQSDVVLMKLDSTGQVVISRGLGAASNAAGYAISVSDDGRVAVAGSVTGGLIPGQSGANAGLSDSFVSVFDANGVEQWTHSRGAKAADEATAVSFGADGKVYVSGRAQSAMPGTTASGGWDSYVQVFGESQSHATAPIKATSMGTTQFGTAGDDSVQAMTVDGDNLYTAGIENGSFVVRQFSIGQDGAPQLLSTRNLGAAHNGEIAGIAVSDGKLIVSGATRNAGLNIDTVTRAHAGGSDAFVANLSMDLQASGDDRLTYYGTAGDDTAADVKIVDGEVWLTGTWDRARTAKDTDPSIAYLARIDATTGAVDWNRTWTGDKQQAKPLALAVTSNGSSVLDKLGLPSGELVQDVSQKLVDSTGLRAGDRFYVTNPNTNRKTAVTIDARDTLQTLATKIETASGRNLKVTVSTNRGEGPATEGDSRVLQGGGQYLTLTNADGRKGALISSGETGRDALAGLGLTAGYVGKGSDKRKTIGLELPASLNLLNADSVIQARDFVQSALRSVREAYRAMSPTMLNANKGPVGAPSPYMQSQIANYQAALARLGG